MSTVFERQRPDEALIDAALTATVAAPFWLDDLAPRARYPALQGDRDADLAIVGGGYLGLWSALLAKERFPDLDVVLLEADTIGGAASGRNGGFCEASLTHGEENARRRWPDEADALHELGLRNLDEFEATLQRHGIECDFERVGTLSIAVEPYQVAMCDGPDALSPSQVRDEIASPIVLAGAWDRAGGALLHPGKLAAELTRVVQALGVTLHEGARVTGLAADREAVMLSTATGRLRAGRAILATNVFPALLARDRRRTIPVYDYVLMTEPLTADQRAAIGWRHRQGVADLGNQFHYLRLTRDDRILFGGWDAVYHFGGRIRPEYEERPESYRTLARHFFTMFPQLAGVKFSHRWAGVIDTSSRFCAFFTQSHGGRVASAAGFTGLGVGATRFAANVLLDQIFGLATERTALRMVRERPLAFPPEPLTWLAVTSTQRALARADRAGGRRGPWLRALDALGLGFDS